MISSPNILINSFFRCYHNRLLWYLDRIWVWSASHHAVFTSLKIALIDKVVLPVIGKPIIIKNNQYIVNLTSFQ